MNKKRSSHRKRKDSGYLIPILCVTILTILSAVLITLCITVILSSEEVPPVTSTSGMSADGTTVNTPNTTPLPVTSDTTAPITTSAPITGSATQTTTKVPETTPVVTTPAPVTTEPPATTAPPTVTTVPGGFKADLSAYERYMNPTGEYWDDAYLMLVNAKNKLESNQETSYPVLGGIVKFSTVDEYNYKQAVGDNLSLNENALMALTAMFLEAEANGIRKLDVTSAHRTYSYQSWLFYDIYCKNTYHWICENSGCTADWIAKESVCPVCGQKTSSTIPITQAEREANVATYSCPPGTSEHQSGLAVDVVQTSLPSQYQSLIQEFGETEAGKWLAENCWKFGFVLRFPQDKEEITGIIYEPWHFRFVGRTHAAAMNEMNMCLEEYIEYLESTGYFN